MADLYFLLRMFGLGRGALEAVIDRGRVFEKLEKEMATQRNKDRKSAAESQLVEGSRIQTGMSREKAMTFMDLMTKEEG